MAAIDEASTDQHEPVEFLTADDLQGITGQLDQLLTGQTSLESKFDLYTSDALDRLTNLDNNIKEIRDYLLKTEQQEDAAPVAIDQVNTHLLQVNENLTQVSQQLDDLTVYHYNMQNIAIPLLCAVSIAAGLLVALIFTHYLKH